MSATATLPSSPHTAFMWEDDTEDDVRFLSVPIEKVVFAADANGRVRTVYIEYEFDADQASQKFGNALSTKIQEAVKNKDYTSRFKFLFCVYPRAVFDPSKLDKKNMPFAAEWIEIETQKQVRESGYREFPFMVSRWAKSGGDVYGSGPAMNELPNIKTLNAMCRTNLIAGEKIADPPLDIPDEAFMRPFDFDAGGINIRAAGYPQEKINPIITGQNIPFALQLEDVRRMSIRQAFFNDLFIILNNQGQMTAEEVMVAATINGAAAVGRAGDTGSLRPGKDADLLVLDVDTYREIPYRFGENFVRYVVAGGGVIKAPKVFKKKYLQES